LRIFAEKVIGERKMPNFCEITLLQKGLGAKVQHRKCTVKLGYNELGYNKPQLITNKTFDLSGLGCFNTHSSRL
jgi:hypothetical protein